MHKICECELTPAVHQGVPLSSWRPRALDEVVESFKERFQQCVAAKGGHFDKIVRK